MLVETERGARELDMPVLSLTFDYGEVGFRASERRERCFIASDGGMAEFERDLAAEAAAERLLEGFGAVELSCLDSFTADYDSVADYVVRVERDTDALCAFTAAALPKLVERGWEVTVDEAYPFRVVAGEPTWYASALPTDERVDWFGLELGVEVDGARVNLLPVLLELLDHSRGGSLKALRRIPSRLRALPVGDGRYVAIPAERLERLLDVLTELYSGEPGFFEYIDFPALASASLAKLEALEATAGMGRLVLEAPAALLARARALAAPASEAARAPTPVVEATLRPYQEEGVAWMQRLADCGAGGVLADDMGLGKTLQTIAHLALEKASGRAEAPNLIVVPTSLVGNWQRELRRFAPHLEVCVLHGAKRKRRFAELRAADVVITTYPLLARDLEHFVSERFHVVVLDEAQAIKNRRSQASRAVRRLDSKHRLCLTGTPVENNLEELWSLFDFLMPGLLGEAEAFRARFRVPIEREGDAARLAALRERVAPFILRRMKETVATELPPKTEILLPIELEGDQRELYESIRVAAHADVRRVIKKKGFGGSSIAILDALMKLRQVCCDPRLCAGEAARKVDGSAKYAAFFELLTAQLAEERRVLVFSQFTRMLALISHGLVERGVEHLVLTGESQNRQDLVDRFQDGEADVFLISLKAGGAGLNLTRADTVIHYDPWWNHAAQAQATDRAYRIGQTRPVFVYELITSGSVEERMHRLQQQKRHLADTILGAGAQGALRADDVDDLFAPLDSDE
ncbi:MAG: DEAD/DEAH box helicase [Sorangiineae bacterium]|nr:DEAD/DEAH box helicase [Polyangiaceae bacterium]MEB2321099.1 DEAD/DEAH box helicase [Sorangiineae bacterium]